MLEVTLVSDNTHDRQALAGYLSMQLPLTGARLLELLGTPEGSRVLPVSPVSGSRITIPVPTYDVELSNTEVDTLLMLGGLPHPMPGMESAAAMLGSRTDGDGFTVHAWPETLPHRGWRLLVHRPAGEDRLQLTVASLVPATGTLLETVVAGLDDAEVSHLVEMALMAEALLLDPADMMRAIQDEGHTLEDDREADTEATRPQASAGHISLQ